MRAIQVRTRRQHPATPTVATPEFQMLEQPPDVDRPAETRFRLDQLLFVAFGLVAVLAIFYARSSSQSSIGRHTSCLAAAAISGVFALAAIGIAKPDAAFSGWLPAKFRACLSRCSCRAWPGAWSPRRFC